MTKITLRLPLFATALACSLHVAPALALNRTFVSSAGNDGNPCAVTAPCRSLQAAFNATGPNGEINVLDPAGYGVLTITHGVSIQGHGLGSVQVTSGGDGITINAGATDKINLRGLLIDGIGIGANGIKFNSGGSLNIQDSQIRNSANGVVFISSGSNVLSITNTEITDNSNDGVEVLTTASGTVTGVFDRVVIENSGNRGVLLSGGGVGNGVNITLSDCAVSNSADAALLLQWSGSPTSAMIRTSVLANSAVGLRASGAAATARISKSAITGNNLGFTFDTGGVISTYGDNNLDGNTVDGAATGTLTLR